MGKMSAAGFIEPFHNSQHGSIEKGLKQPPQAVPTIIYTSPRVSIWPLVEEQHARESQACWQNSDFSID